MTCKSREDLSQYEEKVVRFTTKIGFLADAEVLLAPDPDGPEDAPLLCQLIGPAPPEDQPERTARFGPDSYAVHAEQWAGTTITWGGDIVNLPVPDGDEIWVVEDDEVWDDGRYEIEDVTSGDDVEPLSDEEIERARATSPISVWERADITPGEEYTGVDVEPLIRLLEPGDVVTVEVWAKSYPDRTLAVTRDSIDLVAEDDNGVEYYLIKRYAPTEYAVGEPWLRTVDGYESRGEIRALTVEELGGGRDG